MINFENNRNPLLPVDIHIPDAEAHVWSDGKLYLYGSFDNRSDVFCSEEYHVVSTPDMKHWTIHDTALSGRDIPWFNDPDAPKYPGIDWSRPTPYLRKMLSQMGSEEDIKKKFEKKEENPPALLFAPDCAEKDGRYYLYFCMKDDSEGVAVSSMPEGPFHDPVRLPVGGIDPAVFIDRDGQAYYYWGQLFSHGARLNSDMVSLEPGSCVDDLVTEEKHYFHEGSSMRRVGNLYYYVFADIERGKPTSLGYATADSPLGPFTYRGILIDNDGCDPESWNNHGSIEEFNGQWYVFYHRCSRGTQLHRRLCCEKIDILPDGTIPEVVMTSQGAGGPFLPGEKIPGFRACGVSGQCFIGGEPDERLMHIAGGDTAVFRYVKSAAGFHDVKITASGSGHITFLMNGQEIGSAEVRHGRTVKRVVNGVAGTYELTLRFDSSENLEIRDLTFEDHR